jgi:hypothetical protein
VSLVKSQPRHTEGLEELETLALRINDDRDAGSISRGSLESILSSIKSKIISDRVHVSPLPLAGKLITIRLLQLELLSVSANQFIGGRVEVKTASEDHGGNQLRAGNKGVGVGVSIVSLGEIS